MHQSNKQFKYIIEWLTLIGIIAAITIVGLYIYSSSLNTNRVGYHFKEGWSPDEAYVVKLKAKMIAENADLIELSQQETIAVLKSDAISLEEKMLYVEQLEAVYEHLGLPHAVTDELIDKLLGEQLALDGLVELDGDASDGVADSDEEGDSEFRWF